MDDPAQCNEPEEAREAEVNQRLQGPPLKQLADFGKRKLARAAMTLPEEPWPDIVEIYEGLSDGQGDFMSAKPGIRRPAACIHRRSSAWAVRPGLHRAAARAGAMGERCRSTPTLRIAGLKRGTRLR